jgi:hypothetical protein
MTVRTRRRLIVCLLLAFVTLPAEALVLPVLRTPDPAAAAREWAAALSPADLQAAAVDIHAYPYVFRRAIMGALTPEERSLAWQRHFRDYLNGHPDLDVIQRSVINRAIALATPDVFSGPPAPALVQDQLSAIYGAAMTFFGKTTARELFIRMGPDPGGSGGLPLSMRLTNALRDYFVAYAREVGACECADTTDCELPIASYTCSDTVECTPDIDFPMCGPLWCYACTGTCQVRQPDHTR